MAHHPSTLRIDPGPTWAKNYGDAVGSTRLQQRVISPRSALFIALSVLALPGILAAQGAYIAYSSRESSRVSRQPP